MQHEQIYMTVTNRIVEALRKGVQPWRKPWGKTLDAIPMVLPTNAKTKATYNGINIMLLWLQDRESPYWATKKTWEELGASIIPDELPTEIYFYTFFNGREGKQIPFLRTYEVFNLLQVRGCLELRRNRVGSISDFVPAERIIANSRAVVICDNMAYYDIVKDTIHCPPKERFHTSIGYYTTKLHELAHWSGKRLKRTFGATKESKEYAVEELVAELTSCFLAAHLKIPESLNEMPQHASYIQQWLTILENDVRAIFKAASAAQKATKYLLQFADLPLIC